MNKARMAQKYFGVFLVIVVCPLLLRAADDQMPSPKVVGVPKSKGSPVLDQRLMEVMHKFWRELEEIKGLLVDDKAFADEKNQAAILGWFTRISKNLQKGQSSPTLLSSTYQVTLDMFRQHLFEAQTAFKAGNKAYAQSMLSATGGLCIACHTQIPADKGQLRSLKVSSWPKGKETASDLLRETEFLFISHRYSVALSNYDKLIQDYTPQTLRVDELDRALRRQLMILIRVRQDPAEALVSLQQDLKNTHLPLFAQSNLKSWIKYVNNWAKEKVELDKMNDKELVVFVERKLSPSLHDRAIALSDPHIINYLRLSGALYRRLHSHPESPEAGKMLLLLAKCERYLNNQFFYSLNELLLKQCIHRFPKSPIGQDCYKELEDEIHYAYTGTGGLELPEATRIELALLKKKAGSVEKSESR